MYEDSQSIEGEMANIQRQIRKYEKEIEKFKKAHPDRQVPRFYETEIDRLERRLEYIREEVI